MIEFTLNIGDVVIIDNEIRVISVPKDKPYEHCALAHIGVEAPKHIIISHDKYHNPQLTD